MQKVCYLVHTISKYAILGGTIIVYNYIYNQGVIRNNTQTPTHTKREERKIRREGKRKLKEKKRKLKII